MYYENWTELYHHGVKGQKHGKRRYQNPDGSLTPEGRIHYGVGDKRMKRAKAVVGVGAAVAGAGLANAALLENRRQGYLAEARKYNKATTQAQAAREFEKAGLPAGAGIQAARSLGVLAVENALSLPALSSAAVVAPIAIGGAAALAGLGYIGYKKYQQYKSSKGTTAKHSDLDDILP